MRRKALTQPAPAEIDADDLRRRFRQLARRMHLALPLESPRLKRDIDALAEIEDPAQALAELIDLAVARRSTLPPVCLPEGLIERWRAELAGSK